MDDSILARRHLGIVPFRLLQSWAVKSDIMGWVPGDLVIHFAGCWVRNHCKQSWEEYWQKKGKAIEPGLMGDVEEVEEHSDWWSWLPTWSVEDAQVDTHSR